MRKPCMPLSRNLGCVVIMLCEDMSQLYVNRTWPCIIAPVRSQPIGDDLRACKSLSNSGEKFYNSPGISSSGFKFSK